jgi:hypothetical protein
MPFYGYIAHFFAGAFLCNALPKERIRSIGDRSTCHRISEQEKKYAA